MAKNFLDPGVLRCPNCQKGFLNALTQKNAEPVPRTIWWCGSCGQFFQPFLVMGESPTTIWNIKCTECQHNGAINGGDSTRQLVRDKAERMEDEDDGDITLVECVHCHRVAEYNIRVPCKTLYPKTPN